MADVDPQLRLLKRQYFQLFEPDFLAWPHPQLLRRSDAQAWLFKHLFDESRNPRLPPERYQLRVLRPLVSRIEKSIQDPEEDVRVYIFLLLRTPIMTLILDTRKYQMI